MPGITVLPSTPIGFSPSYSSSSAMQNGYSNNDETVADIKDRAREKALSVAKTKGISVTLLMRAAQSSAFDARKAEDSGDLKKSLGLWVQASSLTSALFDTADFKAEAQPGKRGAVYREVTEWMQSHAQDIIDKTQRVETKLKELESSGAPSSLGSSGQKSIAGRIASLQNAGLSVSSTKRASREVTNGINGTTLSTSSSSLPSLPPTALPSSPVSPTPARPFNRLSLQTSVMTPMQPMPTPIVSTPHTLIPASSFGPPSPVSSTSDSPKITPASPFSPPSVLEFQHYFPTIDELEEMDNLKITDNGPDPGQPQHPPSDTVQNGTSQPIPIPIPTKPFPALPFDLSQRPSSTPIPPSYDVLMGSRPSSPAARPPLSPTVLRKPSNLFLSSSAKPLLAPSTSQGNTSSPGSSPRADNPELPKLPKSTMCTPKDLYGYMYNIGYKVLILDVRPREEFEKEHIKASAIVSLEPLVLKRDNVNGDTIEDSLHVAPRGERTLFSNRDKFDVIVITDKSSENNRDNAALAALVQAIYEKAFKRYLKQAPMLLVGGLDAWKREFGDAEVNRGVSSSASPAPALNDGISSSSSSSSMRYTSPPYVRNRSGTESSLSLSSTSRDLGALNETPRLTPSTESSPGPSHNLPQLPEGINGFGSDPKLFNRHTATNGRPFSSNRTDLVTTGYVNGTTSIQYPSYPKPAITSASSLSSPPPTHAINEPALPPTASINPYPFRRRNDLPDQTQEALSTFSSRSVDYPDLSSSSVLRPPPVAAAPALERQENRPRLPHHAHSFSLTGPRPLMIQSDYPVTYWSNVQIGISGLKNLGNTCYMNSTIQCLSATVPFSRFFTDGRWKSAVNMVNPLGTKGNLAHSFSMIIHEMWQAEMPYLTPLGFRKSICSHAPQFSGSDQHDAQEFLSFLLDGLHEDLNRVLQKPQVQTMPEREAELERLPLQIASQQEWETYKSRNDSLIVDFFQGQFRNRMECLTCHKTSTTYNPFMYLSLPIPTSRGGKVALQACLDALVNKEVMTGSEAWNCPNCKALRQATKQLSLSRLPPVLMIHLKRFSFKGPFTDKIESFVDFPMKDLDLTGYMPYVDAKLEAKLPPDDARAQIPPFKYDLYAVTNHFGSLSSGHYTAFISSRGGWVYCDDSRVTHVDAKEVVGKPAYILYYKRVKT